jgi:hypothetical protein
MLTVLLLLPVFLVLIWLYWYLLPGRSWKGADSLILLSLAGLIAFFLAAIESLHLEDGGPLWPYIVSATGAYGILTLGLGLALALRWYQSK